MEFCEKLQILRKNKGITQEELAKNLYVSRTAVSKWESGKGYPGIESLKRIGEYFDVTVDELLSGEKIISIAEKENKSNLRNLCDLFFACVDICHILLLLLPLYPNAIDSYIHSVNLFLYAQGSMVNVVFYWILFSSMIILGSLNLILIKFKEHKGRKVLIWISVVFSVATVLLLAITREAYAAVVAILLLVIKGLLLLKRVKSEM